MYVTTSMYWLGTKIINTETYLGPYQTLTVELFLQK